MPAARRPRSRRYAIVRARFNAPITDMLLAGARRAFADAKVPDGDVSVTEVPGAFELPAAALMLAQSKKYAAIVALGCVIRGETPHFEYVASSASRGLQDVALRTGIPIAFGVLTTDDEAQARARAGDPSKAKRDHAGGPQRANKGYEAALVAIEMAQLREKLKHS